MRFLLAATTLASLSLAVPWYGAVPWHRSSNELSSSGSNDMGASQPKAVASPAPAGQETFWAENDAEYKRCNDKLRRADGSDNPCVKTIFYMKGSVDAIKSSCTSPSEFGNVNKIININWMTFPKDIFLDGNKCGYTNSRPGSTASRALDKDDFRPVCGCFN